MGGLAAFLTAIVPVIAKALLIRLGIGIISYISIIAAVNYYLAQAKAAWAGMPADLAAYAAMSGMNQALAIIAGAYIGRLATMPLKKFGFI